MRFPPLLPALMFALLLASPALAKPVPVAVPPGYLRQALEPTGGEIARPIDWHFLSEETPSGWVWTIAKEDPAAGPYLTGQRIQLMVGVEASSGLTRAAFVQRLLEEKKKGARVIRQCPVADQGDFHVLCLEVEQPVAGGAGSRTFRILHSLMWGKRMDVVVSSTFGAPAETWKEASRIAGPMAGFRLLDGDIERLASKAGHIRSWAAPAPGPIGVVYSVIGADAAARSRDAAFRIAMGQGLNIRDIAREGEGFQPAKPVAGGLPAAAFASNGRPLGGRATLAYVITVEGVAAEPRLVSLSDERLRPTVLAAMRAWRFEPARVQGKPVASLAGQDFEFTLPGAKE